MTKLTNPYLLGPLKRSLDLLLSLVLMPVLLPLMGITTLLLLIPTGGKVFYSQNRVGQGGKVYIMFKFRTLKANAVHDTAGMSKTADDFLPFGKWVRRWRLDEFPQVFNILAGSMSWIGPRPERPHIFSHQVESHPELAQRLAAKPGITGWAQIHLPNATPLENLQKLPYDQEYVQRANLGMDVHILFKTLGAVI